MAPVGPMAQKGAVPRPNGACRGGKLGVEEGRSGLGKGGARMHGRKGARAKGERTRGRGGKGEKGLLCVHATCEGGAPPLIDNTSFTFQVNAIPKGHQELY